VEEISGRIAIVSAAIVLAIVAALVLVTSYPPGRRSPPAIPPGETRGLIFTCLFNGGAGGMTLRVTVDSVEVAKVAIPRRQAECASPLVDPGTHNVSIYCDMDSQSRFWSNRVDISSRQVVELPGGGLNYVCP